MSIKPFQRKWSTTLIRATTIIRDWRVCKKLLIRAGWSTACGSKIEGLILQLLLHKLLVFRPNTLGGIFFDIQLLKQNAIILIVIVPYMKKFNFCKSSQNMSASITTVIGHILKIISFF